MRLLHTTTGCLSDFLEGNIPPYAILSHTWGPDGDEVQFRDMRDLKVAKTRKAWSKVAGCCQRARKEGFSWVWIDTCCIDKSSSAELSEAINSMWQWYKDAKVCYAYLADIKPISLFARPRNHGEMHTILAPSRWFTRGWTLQELIAPSKMDFVSSDWGWIGDKKSLQDVLCTITGIEVEYLLGGDLSQACIAQKMCWASQRQTTRSEDIAYCLLGIFGINMPLLYGEGKRAFRRLQEEIIRASGDQTIFAWTRPSVPGTTEETASVLANHPSCFADSADIRQYEGPNTVTSTLTNQGIRTQLYLDRKKYDMALILCRHTKDKRRVIGIWLRIFGRVVEVNHGHNIEVHHQPDHADRLFPDRFCSGVPDLSYLKAIYLR